MAQNASLPKGWKWTTLGESTKPMQKRVNPQNYPDLPYIGMENVEAHTMRLLGTVPAKQMKSSADSFNDGDILYGRLRPYLNKVLCPGFNGLCSTEFIIFRKVPHIYSKYLQYFLNSWDFVNFSNSLNAGDRPRVKFEQFADYPFLLPPLLEQERIVAKIEELFTQLEAGTAALRRVQAGLKSYKASVLKGACDGRLVSQDPSDEPAEELLRRLGKSPLVDDELSSLPEGWCWTTVNDLAKVGTGATPLRSKSKYWENATIPWITSGALNELQVYHAEEFINEIALRETNAKIFPAGSLLVAMYGEGKTRGKISELLIDATTNQACAALVFDGLGAECKPFVKLFFQKNYEDIRRLSSGGVQPNLNLSIIKSTRVPLSPIAEQFRIVAEVERRLSVIQTLEGVVSANLKRAERLRQSILKRAFEGKLVEQDPPDEPGEELLEMKTPAAKMTDIAAFKQTKLF